MIGFKSTAVARVLARVCRCAILGLGIALGSLWLVAPVHGQSLTDRADKPTRNDADDKTDKGDKDLTFGLDVPLRHSSSVANPNLDAVVSDRPDRHVTPDIYLKWSRQYEWYKLTAEVGASLDRYFTVKDANLDSLRGSFKFAKTDGKDERFVPYFSFAHETYFTPTFDQADLSFNDIAIGFYSGWGWRDKSRNPYLHSFIPYADASEPGDFTIMFDARFGRRLSETTNFQNTFALGRLTATYYITDAWRIEASAALRARWYENYHDAPRTDYRPSASVGLIWTPDWLKKIVKRSELSFNFEYFRNYSTVPEKKYSLWEVGPTLSLRTKF